MLAIRLQRTGRSGHAQFRLIAQDSRYSPTSGRVVTYLGSYDPHTKEASIDKDKVSEFLSKGAQPSDRVAKLLKKEGVKLPSWVTLAPKKKSAIRNMDKLRRNRPKDAPKPEAKVEEPVAEEAASTDEAPVEEKPAEEAKPSEDAALAETEAPAEKATEPEAPKTEAAAEPEVAEEKPEPEPEPEAEAEVKTEADAEKS